jgi:hypothetical protein
MPGATASIYEIAASLRCTMIAYELSTFLIDTQGVVFVRLKNSRRKAAWISLSFTIDVAHPR